MSSGSPYGLFIGAERWKTLSCGYLPDHLVNVNAICCFLWQYHQIGMGCLVVNQPPIALIVSVGLKKPKWEKRIKPLKLQLHFGTQWPTSPLRQSRCSPIHWKFASNDQYVQILALMSVNFHLSALQVFSSFQVYVLWEVFWQETRIITCSWVPWCQVGCHFTRRLVRSHCLLRFLNVAAQKKVLVLWPEFLFFVQHTTRADLKFPNVCRQLNSWNDSVQVQ